MSTKFKLTAAALALIVATGSFAASTEQARAAKLNPAVGVGIVLGVGLLAGAALANRASSPPRAYGHQSRDWDDDEAAPPRYKSFRSKQSRDWDDDEAGEQRFSRASHKSFRNKPSRGKKCPRGQYRNQNGVCQPNETGS